MIAVANRLYINPELADASRQCSAREWGIGLYEVLTRFVSPGLNAEAARHPRPRPDNRSTSYALFSAEVGDLQRADLLPGAFDTSK
jgi:hypothetical protein